MQRAAERLGEVAVADRLWRGRVDRAAPAPRRRARGGRSRRRRRRGSTASAGAPPATGPPMPALKNGSILPSAPPSLSSTTPVRTRTTRMPSSSAALAASPSQITHTWARKSSPRRRLLGQLLVAVRAVVADGGGADQRLRAVLGGAEPVDQVARAQLARLADAALGVVAPALGDVLARQVHDGVAALERLDRRGARRRVPLDGLGAGQRLARAVRVPREHGHLVAAAGQLAHQPGAEQPGRAGQSHSHGWSTDLARGVITGGLRWRTRSRPRRRSPRPGASPRRPRRRPPSRPRRG